jgi:hypothetical protein
MKVFRIEYDNCHYFSELPPPWEELEIGTTVFVEEMDRELFEELEEFSGF